MNESARIAADALMRCEEIGLAPMLRQLHTWGLVNRLPITKVSVDFGDDELSRHLLRGATYYGILIDDR